ncbi:MAG: hypothetical protein HY586_08150 [Candidatus Omnitrophica bacterium]|nr:hypothetical protein [Candidatus Omnitrophota bacterium]
MTSTQFLRSSESSGTPQSVRPEFAPKKPGKKILSRFSFTAIAFICSVLVYLWLPNATSGLMIAVIEHKAKVDIRYEKKITRGFSWVHYRNLSVQRGAGFEVKARDAAIRYNILDLLWGKFELWLDAHTVKVAAQEGSGGKGKNILDSFEFDELESRFVLAAKKKVRIDYFRLRGPMGNILVQGTLREGLDIHMIFSCFLSREFLLSLPGFIRENLFKDNELPLKHFTFRLEGAWQSPAIDFQSDLIRFNFRVKEEPRK